VAEVRDRDPAVERIVLARKIEPLAPLAEFERRQDLDGGEQEADGDRGQQSGRRQETIPPCVWRRGGRGRGGRSFDFGNQGRAEEGVADDRQECDEGQVEMAGEQEDREQDRDRDQPSQAALLEPGLRGPQEEGEISAADDRPFEAGPGGKPAVDEDQPAEERAEGL